MSKVHQILAPLRSSYAFLQRHRLQRLLGILALVLILYFLLMQTKAEARSERNHEILARRFGFYVAVGVLLKAGASGGRSNNSQRPLIRFIISTNSSKFPGFTR